MSRLRKKAIRFQPTLPARGATREIIIDAADMSISTHAPRTGSDTPEALNIYCHYIFQPTLPARGATVKRVTPRRRRQQFQPTLPARGATLFDAQATYAESNFNPRSPHGERRCWKTQRRTWRKNFNPRSPHGERPLKSGKHHHSPHFNPRSPHGERLYSCGGDYCVGWKFQPTLPARGATAQSNNSVDQNHRLCTKSIPQNSPFEN